ncbi:hypothetical protein H9655_16435 [Cytobacillus sp. Sa5YUA1]|uniref:Uncharacterized protein n=1 Tax=Cytobacillus stercorigallinarum TaxID=2762240 RepID=A0ABR8QT07_9BACI|nr:hypothetical protein [Cytobacillus stercorigallinarum]
MIVSTNLPFQYLLLNRTELIPIIDVYDKSIVKSKYKFELIFGIYSINKTIVKAKNIKLITDVTLAKSTLNEIRYVAVNP